MIPIELKAIETLKSYNGTNDYILWLKRQMTGGQMVMSRTQAKYINDYHDTNPVFVNKYVPMHPYYGSYFQKLCKLPNTPTHILIYKVLSRTDDELHIWGAFEENPRYHQSIFINKRAFRKTKAVKELNFDEYERKPKPHQVVAIKTLLANDRFILADTMGLGKTTSAIIAAVEGGFKKILVVCPASLKLNWKKEISFYQDPSTVGVVDGSNFTSLKWTVINYDILKYHHQLPERGTKKADMPVSPIDFQKFDLVIADEAHYLKNASSDRTKLFLDFVQHIPTRWLLTGTPVTNKPIDLFSLLKICDSPLSVNWAGFVRRYCEGKQFTRKDTGSKFWVTGGASNLEELRAYTSELILRRTKKELDLPPKTVNQIYLPLSMGARYQQYMNEYEMWVDDMQSRGEDLPPTAHLTKLGAVRQLLAKDKVQHTIDQIQEYIDEGQKVIVFSCFESTLHEIYEHFKKQAVLVDGGVSSSKRQAAVEKFQNSDKTMVFCGNIVAAGVGLTLTKATIVIFNDLDWSPANHAQAEDRAHRMGQENEVHIHYQLVEGTIDIDVYNALRRKMQVINVLMGDEELEIETESMRKMVLKSLQDGKKKNV